MQRFILAFVALLTLSACQFFRPVPPQTDVDEHVLARAPTDQSSWISDRGSYKEQRYSSSGLINEQNLDSLRLLWSLDLDGYSYQTPLSIDNTIYLSVPGKSALAVDAETGAVLWKVSARGQHSSMARPEQGGMAIWGNNLYVASSDGRLLAFDRRRGKLLWQTQVVQQPEQFFTSPPRPIGGSLVISVGDWGVGGGYLAAYDADSGAEVWRYLPEGGELNQQDSLQFLAYDGELDIAYLAVWAPLAESEDSHFSCPRLVAVQASNGEYLWEVPAATNPVRLCRQHATALLELLVDGRMKALLVQSLGSSGINLVDRVTGQVVTVDEQNAIVAIESREAGESATTAEDCDLSGARLPLSSAMAVDPINKLIFLGLDNAKESGCKNSSGSLLAWDPVARETRWLIGRPDRITGLLATGGNLLFQAAQSELAAYDSSTGEKRWSYPLQGISAPISYQIEGRQYIAVVAANSDGRPQLMVFALDDSADALQGDS